MDYITFEIVKSLENGFQALAMVSHGFVPKDDIGGLDEFESLRLSHGIALHGFIIVQLLVIILLYRKNKERMSSAALSFRVILSAKRRATYCVN